MFSHEEKYVTSIYKTQEASTVEDLPLPRKTDELFYAARKGKLDKVKELIQDEMLEIDINEFNTKGETLLNVAVQSEKNTKLVEFCVKEAKANVNQKDLRGLTPVLAATQANQLNNLKSLIQIGADVNQVDEAGNNALMLAAAQGDLEIVQYLVKEVKLNIDATNSKGESALYLAALREKKEIVGSLKKAGAQIDLHTAILLKDKDRIKTLVKDTKDINDIKQYGKTCLHLAIEQGDEDLVRKLIDAKADVQLTNQREETPLFLAAKKGLLNTVQFLADQKEVDVNKANKEGESPLMQAALHGHLAVVQYLVNKFTAIDVLKKNQKEETAFDLAAAQGHLEVVEFLQNTQQGTQDRSKALFLSAQQGHKAVVTYLVETVKVNVNQTDPSDRSVLFCAAEEGHLELIKYLVEHKANLAQRDKKQESVLMCAAKNGHLETVKWLVEEKITGDKSQEELEQALVLAIESGHLAVVKYLLNRKASDVKTPFTHGQHKEKTALTLATQSGNLEVVKYLVEEFKLNVNQSDRHNQPPLFYAVAEDCIELVDYLSKKTNPRQRNHEGETALVKAVKKGALDSVRYLVEKMGMDITQLHEGKSLLRLAAETGQLKLFKYLNKARHKIVDFTFPENGETLLTVAVRNGHLELVKHLLNQETWSLKQLQKILVDSIIEGKVKKEIVQQLLSKGGKVDFHIAVCLEDQNAIESLMEDKQENINSAKQYGKTPLLLAIIRGGLSLVKALVKAKATVNESDVLKAVELGYLEIVKYLIREVGISYSQEDTLFTAIKKHNLDMVRYFIAEEKISANLVNREGQSALFVAARYKAWGYNKDIPHYLLQAGAGSRLDLCTAILLESLPDIRRFLQQGETVNAEKYGHPPLYYAIEVNSLDIVNLLINAGARVNKDILLYCASKGRLDILKYLLEKGKISIQEHDQENLLINAIKNERLGIVDYLFNQKKMDMRQLIKQGQEEGKTLLVLAVEHEQISIIKYLLNEVKVDVNQRDRHGNTPLLQAIRSQGPWYKPEILSCLVKAKADLCQVDQRGKVPLVVAAESGDKPTVRFLLESGSQMDSRMPVQPFEALDMLHYFVEKNDLEKVKCLKEMKAGVDRHNQQGETALLIAVQQRSLPMIRYLVEEMRANVNQTFRNGDSPLILATRQEQYDTVEYLLKQSADPNQADSVGMSSLALAIDKNPINKGIVERLLEAKAEPHKRNKKMETPVTLAINRGHDQAFKGLLGKSKEGTDAFYADGQTLLTLAIKNNRLGMVKYLVEEVGVGINQTNEQKQTPLAVAIDTDNLATIEYLLKQRVTVETSQIEYLKKRIYDFVRNEKEKSSVLVKDLIKELKLDIHQANEKGETLLNIAVEKGRQDLVEYLVNEAKVDVNVKCGKNHESLLLFAMQCGQASIIEVLLKAGIKIDEAEATKLKGELYNLVKKNSSLNINTLKQLIRVLKVNVNKRNKGQTLLTLAVSQNRQDVASYLIKEAKAKMDLTNGEKESALFIAIKNKQIDMVTFLLKAGCKVGKRSVKALSKNTELLYQLIRADKERAWLPRFLEAGIDINQVHTAGESLLMRAAKEPDCLGIVKYLISEAKADVNRENDKGDTLAFVAIKENRKDLLAYLVKEAKLDISQKNKQGESLLEVAVKKGYPDIIQYLVQEAKANINEKTAQGETLAFVAIEGNSQSALRKCVEMGLNINQENKAGDTLLMVAARKGSLETVKYLVNEAKANIHKKNEQGETPLALASNRDMALFLLEAGSEMDECSKANLNKLNVLHYLVEKNKLDLLKACVRSGVDVNQESKEGEGDTLLMTIARKGSLETAKYLVNEAKANIHKKNRQGETALALASNRDMALFLLEAGSEIDECSKANLNKLNVLHYLIEKDKLDLLKACVRRGVDVDQESKEGDTPLMAAARKGSLETVKYLVDEAKANIHKKNSQKETALALVSNRDMALFLLEASSEVDERSKANLNKLNVLHYLVEKDKLDLLKVCVRRGVDVNQESKEGDTLLMTAARKGSLKTVEYLVNEASVDIYKSNPRGETALSLASTKDVREFLSLKCVNKLQQLALIKACEEGDLKAVKAAIAQGASPRMIEEKSGKYPLAAAVWGMNPEVVKHLSILIPLEEREKKMNQAEIIKHNQKHYNGETHRAPKFNPAKFKDWYEWLGKIEPSPFLRRLHTKAVEKVWGGSGGDVTYETNRITIAPQRPLTPTGHNGCNFGDGCAQYTAALRYPEAGQRVKEAVDECMNELESSMVKPRSK